MYICTHTHTYTHVRTHTQRGIHIYLLICATTRSPPRALKQLQVRKLCDRQFLETIIFSCKRELFPPYQSFFAVFSQRVLRTALCLNSGDRVFPRLKKVSHIFVALKKIVAAICIRNYYYNYNSAYHREMVYPTTITLLYSYSHK